MKYIQIYQTHCPWWQLCHCYCCCYGQVLVKSLTDLSSRQELELGTEFWNWSQEFIN